MRLSALAEARILDLGTRIQPFGDAVGDLPFLGRSLAALRREELIAARARMDRFTFADYALATAPLLARFEQEGHTRSPIALAVPAHAAAVSLTPVSSVRREGDLLVYDIFLDAPPGATLDELRRLAAPRPIPLELRERRRELPRIGAPPHFIDLPDDGVLAVHIEHWTHLLWTQPLLISALLGRRTEGRRTRKRPSPRPSLIGKGADVHPSAYLEGSIVGPGAVIGACCSIRDSYVGARSILADFTKLSSSVLGEETRTLADANFSHVVALGGGTLTSFLLKDTILGRDVFLTSGVIFWNEALGQPIPVLNRGLLCDTGRKHLGGCAGHRCILGARTIIAPGRALPNDTTIVMRREEGVLRMEDAEPGTPMCWYDAALVPVERVRPGYVAEEIGSIGGSPD